MIHTGVFFLVLDQTAKFFVSHSLKLNETIPVIKNIFHITLVFNSGCAFGLFRDQPGSFFYLASAAAIIPLLYFLARHKNENIFHNLAVVLIIFGSISNLADRLRLGYIIDFLDFRVWPVFNFGDTAITIGVLIFLLRLFICRT